MLASGRTLSLLLGTVVTLGLFACDESTPRMIEPENGPGAADPFPEPEPEPTPAARTATTPATPVSPSGGAPEWLEKGPTFTDTETGALSGVGMAAGIRNPSLAQTTAYNRARAELAKAVSAKTEVVEGNGDTKIRSHAAVLTDVEPVEHWVDPKSGAVHALVRMKK